MLYIYLFFIQFSCEKKALSLAGIFELGLESVGVEEDSDSGSNSSGRQVVLESSNADTVGTVGSADGSPDASVFGVIFGVMGLVNVGTSLSPIEGSALSIVDTLDLQEDLVLVLSLLGSSESSENGLNPQSAGSSLSGGLLDFLGVVTDLLLGCVSHDEFL